MARALAGSELDAFERFVGGLDDRLATEQRARLELQRHADTRTDQLVAEVEELRTRLRSSRDDIESIRNALVGLREGGEQLPDSVARISAAVSLLRDEIGSLRAYVEKLQAGFAELQGEVLRIRDDRLPEVDRRFGGFQTSFESLQGLAEELRDQRLPALSRRLDGLVERLHDELVATASLLDRVIAGEPLSVPPADTASEVALPDAVRAASAVFAESFRGARAEISLRVAEYLPVLAKAEPVLDLGCGRGELLEALRDRGVRGRGVDADPVAVDACRRRGLDVKRGDVVEALTGEAPSSLGAVCAVHLLEHLPAAVWMRVIAEAARVLRPGGVLILECPNPESIRVGASLFWTDPTHRSPIHPDAVVFVAKAVGLEVVEVRRARPFPEEQRLDSPGQTPEVRALAQRLDALINGERDVTVVARKP
ncbi:MAG: methyltransferase domain-containing protein [Acidobacteriota bacterium]